MLKSGCDLCAPDQSLQLSQLDFVGNVIQGEYDDGALKISFWHRDLLAYTTVAISN
jgi:hypothetical protein